MQIPAMRLYFQRVSSLSLSNPLEVVKWLGAVQAQDYNSAVWSLGLRLSDARLTTIEAALNQRQIIRTWSLRGTLHFLPAEDVRWMLSIVAPGAKARFAKDCAQQGLDEMAFSKIFAATEKVLQGRALSRKAFMAALAGEGINTEGRNTSLIMYRTAQDGLIAVAESGKEDKYGLLAELAPKQIEMSREEALGEAARRYFSSHAPATIYDFAWWLGITITEAKQGLDAVKSQFVSEKLSNQVYWMPQESPVIPDSAALYLHSGFDEIFLGYKDRRLIVDYERELMINQGNAVYRWTILRDGLIVGTWKRTIRKNKILIESVPFEAMGEMDSGAFLKSAKVYADFLGMDVE